MNLAETLRKDYEEVLSWSPAKFALWVAYFRLKDERLQKRIKDSRNNR